jgi:hypothetical protein
VGEYSWRAVERFIVVPNGVQDMAADHRMNGEPGNWLSTTKTDITKNLQDREFCKALNEDEEEV